MKYLIFLLLTSIAFSQVLLNETFSNFLPDTTGKKIIAQYQFNATAGTDISQFSHTLTPSGFSTNYADELVPGNPIDGGNALDFNGSNEYLYTTTASDFYMIDGEDYTWSFICKMPNLWTGTVIGIGSGNDMYIRAANAALNGVGIYTRFNDGTDIYDWTRGASTPWIVGWNKCSIVWDDSDSLAIYINGVAVPVLTANGTFSNINNVASAGNFYIGRIPAGQYFGEILAYVEVANTALTPKQVKELAWLAPGWVSLSGGVCRDTTGGIWAFNQGIMTDTISHSIAAGAAVGHIDAWGATGGETLTVFNKAGVSQNFILTTDSTRYTISSITFAENDSLFIGSAGTVTVDNVYLETAPDVSPNIYSNNFTGFPEFPDFINDEAIQ